MSRRTYFSPWPNGRLLHKMALFFLLFVCLDIAFPPPCAEASENLSASSSVVVVIDHTSVERATGMFTTGLWYFRRGSVDHGSLTQKVEWGISDRLQVSTFVELLNSSKEFGPRKTGIGDFEIGARYSWARVGSEFTHVALAFDAGFPTGNAQRALGEGSYTLAPSILVSHELGRGKYQIFTTTGLDFVVKRRRLDPTREVPRNSFFSNSSVTAHAGHAGHGWLVSELSITSNRSVHGRETRMAVTPSYVWRLQRRTELLFGIPIGVTSSTDRVGAVVKFTFELGGKPE